MDEITAAKAPEIAPFELQPMPDESARDGADPQVEAPAEPNPRSTWRVYTLFITLCLVLFVAALDQTIVATSIPTISASLHSASGYIWIGGAYVVANTASGPIWARSSDIWGRKPALLLAVVIFAVGSVLAATSVNMAMLIAARGVQGIAGGGLMKLISITISDLFSMRQRSLYIGMMGGVWAVAGSAGPLVGGAFTEYLSWRWCFWINLPISVSAFILLFLFLDVHNPGTKFMDGLKVVDWFGTVSILAVTTLLLLGLDFGGAIFPWTSPKVICLLAVGAAMIAFFIFSQKRLADYPLMPMSVFSSRANNVAIVIAIGHSMVATGIEYYLPLYFQSVKQASPLRSGLYIVPMMAIEAASDILNGVLIHRTGRYIESLWLGVVLLTLGTGLYITFGPDTPIAKVIGFELIGGIGTALLFQTPVLMIQNNVSQADTATATATLGFMRNIATSLSIVLGGVIFQDSMNHQRSSLIAAGLSDNVLDALSGDQAAANVGIVKTIQDSAQQKVVLNAFSQCMRNMFIMYTCLAGVTLIAGAFAQHQDLRTEHEEAKTGIENMKKRKT